MGFRRRGREAATEDVLFTEIASVKKAVQDQVATITDMPQMGTLGAALPSDPFIIARRTGNKGEFVTMGFFIAPTTTSVKVYIIATPDNKDSSGGSVTQADINAARAKVKEFEWDDISDDERKGMFITREFGVALPFSTRFGVVRTVAKNDESGLVATIKNPPDNPYTTLPFPFVDRSSDGITTTVDACFTTGNSDGVNGTDECGTILEVGLVTPRPHPTKYIKSQKVGQRGVKVKMQIIVPRTAKTVRVRLIKTSEIIPGPMPDFTASISYRWDITPGDLSNLDFTGGESDARIFTGDFGERLDFNEEYQTIRIIVEGEGVGGTDNDIIKNPTTSAAALANGTFTAGASTTGTNANLKLDAPWVDVTLDPNNNNIPKGFKIKKAGVKAIMNFLIPSQTQTLKCRIIAANDMNALTLSDEWDDITDAERAAGKCTRQFGTTLEFNTTYNFVGLRAEGDNIGGDAIDVARVSPNSTPAVTGMFTTCDSEGRFTSEVAGVSFVGITKRRPAKREGVFITLSINIPGSTQMVNVKLQRLADRLLPTTEAQAAVVAYDIADITDAERSARNVKREFGIKLDDNTDYGVVRIVAFGDGVNSSGQGGGNPDIFRLPKGQITPPYTYVLDSLGRSTFNTGNNSSIIDSGPPSYSSNSLVKFRFRFKQTALRIGFNPPDVNNNSLIGLFITFVFVADPGIDLFSGNQFTSIGPGTRSEFFFNPRTLDFSQFNSTTDNSLQPQDQIQTLVTGAAQIPSSPDFAGVGDQTSPEFTIDRFGLMGDSEDIPAVIMNAVRGAFNSGLPNKVAGIFALGFIFNQFVGTGLFSNSLSLESFRFDFPFSGPRRFSDVHLINGAPFS